MFVITYPCLLPRSSPGTSGVGRALTHLLRPDLLLPPLRTYNIYMCCFQEGPSGFPTKPHRLLPPPPFRESRRVRCEYH